MIEVNVENRGGAPIAMREWNVTSDGPDETVDFSWSKHDEDPFHGRPGRIEQMVGRMALGIKAIQLKRAVIP
jgi:hypothetical protein